MSNCYLHYNEYDFDKQFPTLIIQTERDSIGYDVNLETGEVTRTCICEARSSNECCCGGFEE